MPFDSALALPKRSRAANRFFIQKSTRISGHSLVELIAAISIIAVLVALLLPALNSAREASRRAICLNNLRQLSSSVLVHLQYHRHFPTGGWGERWIGMPNQGYGSDQPGGWVYNILPYLELQSLHDLGQTAPLDQPDQAANAQRLSTPLALLHCPSRRGARLYANRRKYLFCEPVQRVARSDYAINGGHRYVRYAESPTSLPVPRDFAWPDMAHSTGISFLRSEVTMAEVIDGASNTYLLGEKHLPTVAYRSGEDLGDNETMYSGDDRDIIRYTGHWTEISSRPLPDHADTERPGLVFGSAHPHGFHASNCDGSTHHRRFDIDQVIHSRLGQRNDRMLLKEE